MNFAETLFFNKQPTRLMIREFLLNYLLFSSIFSSQCNSCCSRMSEEFSIIHGNTGDSMKNNLKRMAVVEYIYS